MSMLMLIFFISLLTPKLLAEGYSNLTSHQPGDHHCKNYDQLLSIGPCQKNLIYCQNGMLLHLNCPEPLIFNPSSKFCEKPEDFLKVATVASTNTNYLPMPPPNNILMPFVGQTEPEIEHSYYSVPVLMPPTPNDIRPPYVGKLEPETDDNSYYPVLMPSNDIQPIGRMQPEIDDDSSYKPPFIGRMQPEIDDDSSYQPPFIGSMEQPEIDDDSSYRPPFIGRMEQSEIDDSSYQPPFIGRMEPTTDDTSYSVLLMPPNEIQSPFIGKMEPEMDDDSSYSVLVPSNDIQQQPPFVGKMEPEEIEEPSSYSVLMPSNDIQPPFIGRMQQEIDDESSYQPPFVGRMEQPEIVHKYQQEPAKPQDTVDNSEPIYDAFMVEHQPREESESQKPLVDHFKSSADSHSSKISPFAAFDHPADSGHNSFKPKIHPQIVHSKFAPMDTTVELGHNDIQQQPPFFGKMEPEEIEEPSSYSVLVPSNRIRPSFAEHSHHSDPEPSYAASMDKPHDEQFGYEEPVDDSEQIYVPPAMDKYQPEPAGHESRESMNVSDQIHAMNVSDQIHATLVHKYQPEPAKPHDTVDNSEPIYDAFMVKHQPSEESESQKPLVDHFKSSADSHSSKISPFAAFDHPADSGHDSFKPKIHPQIVHSKFAPMDTPVELGHDIFKTRRKRSTGIDGNNMNVCLELYANQLANRAITGYSSMNQSSSQCVAHQIPNGCRQFYIACLDGRRIKRHCPIGLYFDPRMQICKERGQIAACLVHPTPKALLQSAFLQQQQKPAIQTSYEQPQKPITEQPQKPTTQRPYEHPRQQKPTTQAPYEQPKATNEKDQPKTINAYGTSINTSSATIYSTAPTKNASILPTTVTPSPIPRIQQKKGMIKQKPQMPVLYPYGNFPEKFCSELPNGFYRHPKNCSRIVQCFGHELFEYPSCQHDLAFNQLTGVCDYPANVPGCSQLDGSDQFDFAISETEIGLQNDIDDEQQEIASSSTTNSTLHHQSTPSTLDSIGACAGGHSHGDHIEHPDHCSAFLRCVWGKLVPMSCPKGTAFNPMLSVCDYPNRVPNCQIQ